MEPTGPGLCSVLVGAKLFLHLEGFCMVGNTRPLFSSRSNSIIAGKRRDSRSRSASPRRRRRSRSRDGHKDDRSYSSSRSRSRSRSRDRYHDKKRRSSYRSQSRSRYRSGRHRSRSRDERQLTRDEEDFIELVGAKVRENGRDYEDMLLERERGNALFRFLFERRVCLHFADLQTRVMS